MENLNAIFFSAQELDMKQYPVTKPDGSVMYEKTVYQDPKTGLTIIKVLYPKGFLVPWHKHPCIHAHYILKGTMRTSEGDFGPGSFVAFKEGSVMYHGNPDEDVEALVIEDKPFDIFFVDGMPKEYSEYEK